MGHDTPLGQVLMNSKDFMVKLVIYFLKFRRCATSEKPLTTSVCNGHMYFSLSFTSQEKMEPFILYTPCISMETKGYEILRNMTAEFRSSCESVPVCLVF